jgi:dienelactone hydrolase
MMAPSRILMRFSQALPREVAVKAVFGSQRVHEVVKHTLSGDNEMLSGPLQRAFIALILFCVGSLAFAWPPTVGREASSGESIKFNMEAVDFGSTTDLSNQLVKPPGFTKEKKYPVVLVLPACGGSKGKHEEQIRYWVKELTAAGYLAMNVDSLTPRGHRLNCRPRPVEDGRLLRDAYDAAAQLRSISFVDPQRIFTIGFSLGAMTGLLSASPEMTAEVKVRDFRFAANIAVYPGCDYGKGSLYVRPDTDRPILVLMGAKDTESPPAECYPHLERLKAKGVDVTWHTYEEMSHAWDSPLMDGFSKIANNGQSVTYRYSEEATKDTLKRDLEFLERFKAR